MDEKKIKSYFQTWETQSLLDENGALVVGDKKNKLRVIIIAVVSLVAILCVYIYPPILLISFFFLRLLKQSPSKYSFYIDGFLGEDRKKYPYSSIYAIRIFSSYEMKHDKLVTSRCVVINYDKESVLISNDQKNFDLILSFLKESFEPIVLDATYYHTMVDLFAVVVSSGPKGEAYRRTGLKYVKRFFSHTRYKINSCEIDFLDSLQFYDASENPFLNIENDAFILRQNGAGYDEMLQILSALFGCAFASENYVDAGELKCLEQIAHAFGITEWDFNSLKYKYLKDKKEKSQKKNSKDQSKWEQSFEKTYTSQHKQACALLDVKDNASLEDVKSAYRAKVKLCHPDMLPVDASEKDRKNAAVEFRSLTEAYDFLCEELVTVVK